MIELSVPQIGESAEHVKDRVVMVLSEEYPLSIMQIYNKIKKNYNLSVSYQAVRKSIDSLCQKGLLTKTERRYKISKDWALKSKLFFDKLLLNYETGKIGPSIPLDIAKENYLVYTFSNLLDLDNFWGEVMIYWADCLKKDDPREFVATGSYHWWFIINLGRETKIFEHFKKKGIISSFICYRDLPLNRWGMNIYEKLSVKTKIIADKKEDDKIGINLMGDWVIQVYYDDRISERIKSFFERYDNIGNANLQEITHLAHEPCEIKFVLMKNPFLASTLRKSYKSKINLLNKK